MHLYVNPRDELAAADLTLICVDAAQLQFSSPKEHHPERSLKFHVTASVIVNFLNIIYHVGVPLAWDPRGITIDFVGQCKPSLATFVNACRPTLLTPSLPQLCSLSSIHTPALHC